MSKRGKRSKNGKHNQEKRRKEYEQKIAENEVARIIVLDFSWRDSVTREVVFTDMPCGRDKHDNVITYKDFLYARLSQKFGGKVPCSALNHEFGEVLNRFGI